MLHFDFLGFCCGFGLITALGITVSTQSEVVQVLSLLDGLVENALQVALCEGGALRVFHRFYVFRHLNCLLVLYGSHFALSKLFPYFWIVS